MFPKGGMSKLLKQAKQMQKKMEEAQKELEQMKIDGQLHYYMIFLVLKNGSLLLQDLS